MNLILILGRNIETSIIQTLDNLARGLNGLGDVHLLLIDDASRDRTADLAREWKAPRGIHFRVWKNTVRQGVGGNQKIGFALAIREGFSRVAVIRAEDSNLSHEVNLLFSELIHNPRLAFVLGVPSRKSLLNLFVTFLQNRLADVRFHAWHNSCRAYAVDALAKTAFALNTNGDHFETELALQLLGSKATFSEVFVGREPVLARRLHYAHNSVKAALKFKLQKWHLLYDVRYHPDVIFGLSAENHDATYRSKIDSKSPHSILFESDSIVLPGSRVLDVGSASGYVAQELVTRKKCVVTGVDVLPPSSVAPGAFQYEQLNLETQQDKLAELVRKGGFDTILMLDVLEHTAMPEKILLKLSALPYERAPRFVCSTANVAFVVVRLMLMFGHFNYGQKGILDITHKRLFSAHTFRNLFEQTGFIVQKQHYFPFPFRELGFRGVWAQALEKMNLLLIKIRPRLFAYQIMVEAIPLTAASSSPETADSEAAD